MNKVSEAQVDNNGKIQLNGWFRLIAGTLVSLGFGVFAWGFNYLDMNQKDNIKTDIQQQEDITKLQITVAKIDAISEDMKEIKSLLKRQIPTR